MISGDVGHSIIAPSSLSRIRQCPGSVKMVSHFPETRDDARAQAAAEGTAAHWVMAERMAGRSVSICTRAPNGVAVDDEMLEAVDVLIDDVERTVSPFGLTLADCITESSVSIPRIHPECWGTPDVRVWLPKSTLVVWDLKYGFRYVPEFENDQLLAYSVGAVGQSGLADLEVTVINRIVQPRTYTREGPVREWKYRASDVRGQVNLLSAAAHEALSDNPRTIAGPECRDCRAQHACETNQRAGFSAMEVAGTAVPCSLAGAEIGVELRYVDRMSKLLVAREQALREQALVMGAQGARISHFRIDRTPGREAWCKPDAEVIVAGRLLNINLAKPAAALTPKQAVAAGFPKELLATYAERKAGTTVLVADDTAGLRKVFAKSA